MFCRSLFVLLYIFFWPLCCLFFFNIQILITPLVSSNSSYNKQLSLLCVFFFSKSDKRRSNNICSILDILPHSVILNWKCSDSVVFFPFSFLYLKLHYILESICLNSCCHWSSWQRQLIRSCDSLLEYSSSTWINTRRRLYKKCQNA
jgi:hypothetical protein